jgi:hypothetical protein
LEIRGAASLRFDDFIIALPEMVYGLQALLNIKREQLKTVLADFPVRAKG